MGNNPNMSSSPPPESGAPAADVGTRVLAQVLTVMRPLVRWLLRSGVNYGTLSTALKRIFLEEARQELQRTGGKVTDSALSVLSGVHRKDVRTLAHEDDGGPVWSPTPASALFTRWITDPRLREGGALRERLPRQGPLSFETLAREVSTDVHPRTLLEELVRLALVRVEGDEIVLDARSFVPAARAGEAARLLAANGADHLAAAVHNLTVEEGPRFLEQSIFARRLSEASAEHLAAHARTLWADAFQSMASVASDRLAADEGAASRPMRMRFGVYYYHEPMAVTEAPAAAPAPASGDPS